MVCWLSFRILPAAILGARTNSALPTTSLTIILSTLIIFSGLNALYRKPLNRNDNFELSKIQLILIGLGVGFGSSLTGTGGPVLLVPILIFLGTPALIAIGVSQVI